MASIKGVAIEMIKNVQEVMSLNPGQIRLGSTPGNVIRWPNHRTLAAVAMVTMGNERVSSRNCVSRLPSTTVVAMDSTAATSHTGTNQDSTTLPRSRRPGRSRRVPTAAVRRTLKPGWRLDVRSASPASTRARCKSV